MTGAVFYLRSLFCEDFIKAIRLALEYFFSFRSLINVIIWVEIDDIIKEFECRNIKVHHACSVANAKEIINKDVNNRITVAISDYRLYKNPTEKHKKMQPDIAKR